MANVTLVFLTANMFSNLFIRWKSESLLLAFDRNHWL